MMKYQNSTSRYAHSPERPSRAEPIQVKPTKRPQFSFYDDAATEASEEDRCYEEAFPTLGSSTKAKVT